MKDLLDLLCTDPIGQILLCNMVDALDDPDVDSVDSGFLSAFLHVCSAANAHAPAATAAELVSLFTGTAAVPGSGGPASSSSFLLACSAITPGPCGDEEVSTVMELGTLKAIYNESYMANKGHQVIPAHADPSDPGLSDTVEALGRDINAFKVDAAFGGGPRPLFWVAPSSELRSLRGRLGGPSQSFGNAVRDLLGLVHYGDGAILVEAVLPKGATTRWCSARPTFADAGTHSRFRHKPDNATGRCGSGWGCTVDLARFAGPTPVLVIDGSAERVVERVPVQKAWPVGFHLVGEVPYRRGTTSADDDRAFAARLLRSPRSCSDLVQRLLAIL
jgi:hypothetical protein